MDNWDGIISLFIACIEIVLLVNILVFAQKTEAVKLAAGLITLLLVYQFTEFLICGLEFKGSITVYFAFAVITFLPPSALLFTGTITGRNTRLMNLFYIPSAVFTIYYGFIINQFEVISCSPFYASYTYPLGTLYGFFYYLPVIISIIILYFYIRKETNKKNKILASVVLAGFLITSLPVLTAFIMLAAGSSTLLNIIESIMCKFAFFLALAAGIYSLSYLNKQ